MSNQPSGDGIFSTKGFISYGALVDNADRAVALLGELSVYAQTFSRDRKLFSRNSTSTGAIRSTVFSSHIDQTPTELPQSVGLYMVDIGELIYSEASDSSYQDADQLRQILVTEFGSDISNIVLGPLLEQSNLKIPEHLSFDLRPDYAFSDPEEAGVTQLRVKLWFSDRGFVSQYDEFGYEFIAPIDNLDDFFRSRTQVEEDVAQRTQVELFELITVAADGDPYTGLINEMFQYRDPNDPTYRLDTNWVIMYYGAAGNNIDAIKQALQNWILDNSSHTREEWSEIFPDIFTSTEFILTPLWTTYAIPNKTTDPGMYSPTVLMQYATSVVQTTCTGTNYTPAHINANTSVLGTTYKSLGALITGGPDNRDNLYRFFDVFRDYLAVPTASIDFDRMDPETQGWVHLLYQLLYVAETINDYTDVPQGMTRMKRTNGNGDEIMYVVASYRNIQYLVVSKHSMNQLFPPMDIEPLQVTFDGLEGVATLPTAMVDEPYTAQFEGIGGVGPYSYELMGERPSRLTSWSIDAATGEFEALPAFFGQVTVPVRVIDSENRVSQKNFTLHVDSP